MLKKTVCLVILVFLLAPVVAAQPHMDERLIQSPAGESAGGQGSEEAAEALSSVQELEEDTYDRIGAAWELSQDLSYEASGIAFSTFYMVHDEGVDKGTAVMDRADLLAGYSIDRTMFIANKTLNATRNVQPDWDEYRHREAMWDSYYVPPSANDKQTGDGMETTASDQETIPKVWTPVSNLEDGPDAGTSPEPSPSTDAPDLTLHDRSAEATWVPEMSYTQGLLAVVGATVLLTALLVKLLWSLPGVPGARFFTRIKQDVLLDHPTRAMLMQKIGAEPGIHQHALVRRAGLAPTVVRHHLQKLVDGGLLAVVERAGRICYAAKGSIDHQVSAALPFLRSDKPRAILDAVAASPGVSLKEIREALGLSKSHLSYHVSRLREGGLLEVERAGRTTRVRLTSVGRQASTVAA